MAQIAQPREEPGIQGIVSEATEEEEKKKRDEKEIEAEEPEDDESKAEPPEEDVFGRKFEIPAFLRKVS